MAVNFPDSPSNGDSFSVNDTTYVYNATAGYWDITSTVQVSASTSTNAPSNPSSGDFWFDPSSLTTYIYYNDGTSSQWVPANSVGARGPAGPGYPTAYYSAEYTSTSTGNVVFNANSTPSLASYSIGKVNVWVNGVLRSDFIASDGSNVEIALSTGDEVKIVNFGDTDVLDVTASSNDYATYTSLTSNDYATYTTLSSLIDTVQSNVTSGSGGSGVVVYATPDLLPLSGNDVGDQAYVSSTNRLYINTGSGWYSIGLVNTNPNITAVQDANSNTTPFTLAIDGTATVITITASDPEELPLTYSYAVTSGSLTNGGGTTATVVQGTGANTNQFTITPTTNASYVGTFNLTFTVSDGINTSTSINEFTLQFSIPNSKYTTLLATAVDTSDNNNIIDSSTSNHTITVAGDAHAGTFSAYRHGGYSTYFDGSGDYLYAGTTSTNFGTDDFTIEAWIYKTTDASHHVLTNVPSGNDVNYFSIYTSTTQSQIQIRDSSGQAYAYGPAVAPNTWNHVAVTRSSGSVRVFVNGVSGTPVTITKSITSRTTTIGAFLYLGFEGYFTGYISDLRVVKGAALYTSNFSSSLPTERLTTTVSSGTVSLLTCHLPYIADGSSNAHAITVNGNTSTKPFGPYDYKEYSESINGGSIYFDGTGDYLSLPSSTSSLYLTGAFTYECWIYPTSTSGQIYGNWNNQTGNAWAFWFNNAGWQNGMKIYFYRGNYGQNETGIGSTTEMPINCWNHFAITRDSSNNIYIFLNGKSLTLSTYNHPNLSWDSSYSFTNTDPIGIGGTSTYSSFNGHISDAKFVSGSALYTSDFTPPTAPLSSSGSTLHVKGTDASIIDKAQTSNLKLVGNTTGSTTQVKFANTKSMYFDGAGDYITADQIPLGTGDFTIEAYTYLDARLTSFPAIFNNYNSWTAGALGLFAGHNSSTTTNYQVSHNGAGFPSINGGPITYDQWVHLCVERYNGTITLYKNGSSVGSFSSTVALNGVGSNFYIGAAGDSISTSYINGWIQDFRVTKGLARYTANFTPPTAPLTG